MPGKRNRLPQGTLWRRGRLWWFRYRFRGRAYAESLHTGDAEKARRLFDQKMAIVRADAIRGIHPAQSFKVASNGKARLDEAWAVYLKSRSRPQSGTNTLYMYRCQFGEFVSWMETNHPDITHLMDVSEGIADDFMAFLEAERKVSSSTYNKYIATLQRTFRFATGNGGKISTPWDHVRRKSGAQNRRKDFSAGEAVALLNRAMGWLRTLLIIGLYTGQRLVDCCRLAWDQIDFAEGLVRVVPNKTKNSSGLRVELPMHPDLLLHLRELHDAAGRPTSGYVQPEVADRYERCAPEVSRDIQNFIESCGFVIHKQGTGTDDVRAVVQYGFHSLRHTFVSVCMKSEKVNREVIRSIVGDSYLLYNHVDIGSKMKAVEMLPSINPKVGKDNAAGGSPVDVAAMDDTQLARMLKLMEAELERRKAAAGI